MPSQGWSIDATGDTITFVNAPANGAPIVVRKYDTSTYNATQVWAFGAWSYDYGWPREVEFWSDRMVFASNRSQPQTVWMTKTGDYNSFGRSTPIVDDDAVTFTINAREINTIRDLVPLDSLLILTEGGEYKLTGGQNEVVTPSSVGVKPQSFYGVSNVPTAVVGNTALFIQDRGKIVRDLAYQFEADGYVGNNLSIFSAHLLEGHEVVAQAYQQTPFSVVWLVRDDGLLLSLTYIKEQQIVGWARHDTRGKVESVCCVPENGTDSLYMSVRRRIGGTWQRYVERMEPRYQPDPLIPWFVDSAVAFDGRRTAEQAPLTIRSWQDTWQDDDIVSIVFESARPGVYGDEMLVSITTTEYSIEAGQEVATTVSRRLKREPAESSTAYRLIGDLPPEFRNVEIHDWIARFDTFGGLGHLEGLEVVGVGDGFTLPPRTVTAGTVSYPNAYGVIVIGLPYLSDMCTLDVNVIGGESVRAKQKLVNKVSLLVDTTRSVRAGKDARSLEEVRPRTPDDNWGDAIAPWSDALVVDVTGGWSTRGRIFVRQDEPLPITILAAIPDLDVAGVSGGRG